MQVPSKVGFHSGPTGNMSGIGDYWRQLSNGGIPIFHKAADGYGPLFEIATLVPNPHNVEHHLVYRMSTRGQNDGYDYDVPPYHKSPREAAEEHWPRTRAKLPREFDREKVWVEPVNEIDKNRCDWLGRFAFHVANLAHDEGYKVTLFGWSSGEPEREGWETEGMLKYLGLCGERPNQAAISVHEYDFGLAGFEAVYPFHVGRFQMLFDVCDNHGLARPTIHITEWGWSLSQIPAWAVAEGYVTKANQLYAKFPEIKGAAIWNLGKGPEFGDIHNQTQKLIKPLGDYNLQRRFDAPEPGEKAAIDPVFRKEAPEAERVPSEPIKRVVEPELDQSKPVESQTVSQPQMTRPPARPGAQFVRDVTIPDDTRLTTGTRFSKSWRVRNNGSAAWQAGFRLVYVGGTAMTDMTSQPVPVIQPGEEADISITLTVPAAPGTYISDWRFQDEDGKFFGTNLFTRIIAEIRAPVKPRATLQTGVNINPDAPHSNPVDDDTLRGMDWVRFVFKLAARENPAERDDIGHAFAQYDPLIRKYNEKGVKSLIVLNQETVWGNAPWTGNHDWRSYGHQLARVARQIAGRYREYGEQVAYEIWNEGDLPQNPASVYVEPEQFALVLKVVAETIRAASPEAPLVLGGLATGPNRAIPYLQRCLQALGGKWPVDAIGIHPYGRWATRAPFDWGQQFGTLAQAFAEYEKHFPGIPFWISEIGVAADNEIGSQHYSAVADYLMDVYQHVAEQHSHIVPVVIWFAWSDWMRNAGIVDRDGRRKSHVYDAFQDVIKSADRFK